MGSLARQLVLLCVLVLTTFAGFSQSAKIDSLRNALTSSKDSSRVNLLNQLAFEFWDYDVNVAYDYSLQALNLSRQINLAEGEARANTNIGLFHYFNGDYEEAHRRFQLAIDLLKENPASEVYTYTLTRIANLYRLSAQYDTAIYLYQKSLEYLGVKPTMSGGSTLYNIGKAYLEMELYDSAKFYLDRSLEVRESLNEPLMVSATNQEIARYFLEIGQFDSAFQYLKRAEKVGIENNFIEIQIYHAIYSGRLEMERGNYALAIEYIKTSLILLNDYDFEELKIKSLFMLGNIYAEIGEYDGALENLLRARSLNANFQNLKQAAVINYTLGFIYYYQRNIDQAKEVALLAHDQFIQIGLKRKIAMSKNLLGLIELFNKEYAASEEYFDQAMEIYEGLNYSKGIASILYNKSYIYLDNNENRRALQLQLEALEYEKLIDNITGIIISYNSLGSLYLKMGEYQKAEKFLLEANKILTDRPSPSYEEENNLYLSELYRAKSDYKTAYEYLRLSKQNSDSLFSINSANKSQQLSAMHDLEKKELEIESLNRDKETKNTEILIKENQLEKQRLLLYIGGIALLFFSILSYLLYKTIKKLRTTQEELIKAEKRASIGILVAGLGHEINNPLNFIKGGVECLRLSEDSWSEDQQKFLSSIEEGIKRTVSIISVLDQFNKDKDAKPLLCDLTQLVHQGIEMVDHLITPTKKVVILNDLPNMITHGYKDELKQLFKELISNALHSLQDSGEVTIAMQSTNTESIITITDNGVGIDQENLSLIENPFYTTKAPDEGKGFGLYLVDYILNEHDGKIHFDSVKNEGTKVTVTLPKRNVR